jgi:soluble lytic murein transglycosylase-like protein
MGLLFVENATNFLLEDAKMRYAINRGSICRGLAACVFVVATFICGVCCSGERLGLDTERMRLEEWAAKTAKVHGLEPALVCAIIQVESSWRPGIRSSKSACGLMQIMPKTWDWICRDVLGQLKPWAFADATDPEKNITAGCAYLAWLQKHWRTRLDHVVCDLDTAVIASYNCGQGRVLKAKGKVAVLPKETQTYLKRFAAAKESFRLQELEGE